MRKPLPVYPHTKTVVTDEEGKEVASLLPLWQRIAIRTRRVTVLL